MNEQEKIIVKIEQNRKYCGEVTTMFNNELDRLQAELKAELQAEPAACEVTYSVGNRFKNRLNEEFIIVTLPENSAGLRSLLTGLFYGKDKCGVPVNNVERITQSEFMAMGFALDISLTLLKIE